MLVWLFEWLTQFHGGFNVFRYLTLRGISAVITALLLALITGPRMIERLNKRQLGQTVRDDGPQSHLTKQGTPTMGGAFILLSLSTSTLLWADLSNRFIWIAVMSCVAFGVIGWVDDLMKIIHKDPRGIGSRNKFLYQCVVGIVAASVLYLTRESDTDISLILPFVKDFSLNLGIWFIPIATFWVVGFSNAVNLTDGLDGLAIMPTVLVAGALAIFAYVSGHVGFSKYLSIPYVVGSGELMIFCGALVGAGLGFLWFNAYPAQIFMGDVGALALGAALAVVAICVRQEIVLLWMGGIFVIETLSVMIQVASFKLLGRRVFRMAPLHHHYELKGWPEPHVIVRFWIISLILVLMGLATLKIR